MLLISFAYSSVGLGGGSSYTALFTILGLSFVLIPTLTLTLNTVVTASATVQFSRKGHLKARILLPFIASSIPMAYFGGSLHLEELTFQVVLLLSLVAVAARIYLWKDPVLNLPTSMTFRVGLSLVLGAVLGFVAGVVGIGGGIYLVPLILLTGIGTAREAAATGAAFILINSVSGLLARARFEELPWEFMLPLAVTVLIGGLAGSFFGSSKWAAKTIQRVLGMIILTAIVLLAFRIVV
ncbi:MAG: TSUP family transporter [Bacteroidetes bacterium]|nr:TSUP family transporter [Bacteroidota bacterium]